MKKQILSILIISTICWLALFGCAPSLGNGGESGSNSSNSVTSNSKINELIAIQPLYGIESNSEQWSASFILENKNFVIKPFYTSKTYSPVSLNDIKYVLSGWWGNDHSDCILNENKEVYCWGENKRGEVGNGTFESTLKDEFPLEGSSFFSGSGYSFDAYKIMENVIQLFQSSSSFCAINTSNDVYCWGGLPSEQLKSDAYGENILQVNKPTKIAENIKSYYHQKISLVGGNETFLTTEGTLDAYTACHLSGDNLICPFIDLDKKGVLDFETIYMLEDGEYWTSFYIGENGTLSKLNSNGSLTISNEIYIDLVTTWSNDSICGIMESGKVSCWGHNSNDGKLFGSSSNSSQIKSEIPLIIDGIDDAVSFPKQNTYLSNRMCVLTRDSKVKCWGDYFDGIITLTF